MAHIGDLKEGMVVYSADGHRIGKILAVGSSQFQVEKGHLFHRDFLVSISDVVEVKGHGVHLRRPKANIPGVYGGYHDKGYADRGFAGERAPEPATGVGAGIPPSAETAAPRTPQPTGPRADPHLHAPVGTGAQVGMTGDIAHPELGPPLAPALGPTRGVPAHQQAQGERTELPREPPRLAHEDLGQRGAHREVYEDEARPKAPPEREAERPLVPPPERKK